MAAIHSVTRQLIPPGTFTTPGVGLDTAQRFVGSTLTIEETGLGPQPAGVIETQGSADDGATWRTFSTFGFDGPAITETGYPVAWATLFRVTATITSAGFVTLDLAEG